MTKMQTDARNTIFYLYILNARKHETSSWRRVRLMVRGGGGKRTSHQRLISTYCETHNALLT